VAVVQNNFHVAERDEATVLDVCAADRIGFAPFFPLGGGQADIDDDRVAKVAARHGATVHQVALAWLLALSPVTLAIPGTGSLDHLEDNMAARSITLTSDDLADLA
jgi:pyridoxine 4-dehydrogenase